MSTGTGIRSRVENYRDSGGSGVKDSIAVGQALGVAGLIAPSINKIIQGAMYSAGADPLVGQHGFGFAVFNEQLLSKVPEKQSKVLPVMPRQFPISFAGNVVTPSGGVLGAFQPPQVESSKILDTKAAGLGQKAGKAVMKQGLMNSLLPVGMTAWFAADAYSSDGMTGLGKYLVADVLGNYYGAQAGLFSGVITNVGDAAKTLSSMSGTSVDTIKATAGFAEGAGVQRINPILRSGMVGRVAPVMGGIVGATVGMELGVTAGSAVTSMIGYNLDDDVGRFGGGFFGALAGAKFGAYALSSIARLGVVGLGVAATTSIASNTMTAIQKGFENTAKNRGLNYAGETAAYFTQNAVTMRERAMQSIHKSHLNARSAFGQEASLMHMNRDMFSHYKRAL